MDRETCLRCGGRMEWVGQEKLQLGKYGVLLGHLSQLFSGALSVSIYCCRDCKKLEFYAVETPEDGEGHMVRIPCPGCGQLHEMDDPKCPHCGRRLME